MLISPTESFKYNNNNVLIQTKVHRYNTGRQMYVYINTHVEHRKIYVKNMSDKHEEIYPHVV